MYNIRNLAAWKKLKENGFEEIRFYGPGRKVVAIGAALQKEVYGIHGGTFKADVICIEPMGFRHKKERYKITGTYVERYPQYLVEESGRRKFMGYADHCHTYVKATDILKTVSQLKIT